MLSHIIQSTEDCWKSKHRNIAQRSNPVIPLMPVIVGSQLGDLDALFNHWFYAYGRNDFSSVLECDFIPQTYINAGFTLNFDYINDEMFKKLIERLLINSQQMNIPVMRALTQYKFCAQY